MKSFNKPNKNLSIMKTFKITFFEKFDIFTVKTYHNVIDQSALIENIAINIVTLGLAPTVRATAEDKDYTEVVNHFLKYDIEDIDKDYAKNWYNNI